MKPGMNIQFSPTSSQKLIYLDVRDAGQKVSRMPASDQRKPTRIRLGLSPESFEGVDLDIRGDDQFEGVARAGLFNQCSMERLPL
jgi:hypothetical protein